MVQVIKRLSRSSLTNIISPLYDELTDRSLGKHVKGSFTEHMDTLETIAYQYLAHVDPLKPAASRGLTAQRAEELLKQHGLNVLTPPPKIPLWLLFLLQFTNVLMLLLIFVATVAIILYFVHPVQYTNLYIGILLFIAVFITCYETYSQEAKSDSLMEKFRAMVPAQASVIRDGVMRPVDSSHIAVGDLLRLKSGDKVPADCRIILNDSMKVTRDQLSI